jgi:hypothetical protein
VELEMPSPIAGFFFAVNRRDAEAALRAFSTTAVVEIKPTRAVCSGPSLRQLALHVTRDEAVRLEPRSYQRVDVEHIVNATLGAPCMEGALRMHFILVRTSISSLRIYGAACDHKGGVPHDRS